MDEFVKGKLIDWGLSTLVESFSDNHIDEEVFPTLNQEDIKELIPILGLRKKFLEKFQEYISLYEASLHSVLLHNTDVTDSDTNSTITVLSETPSSIPSTGEESGGQIPLRYYSEKASIGLPYTILPIPDDNNSVKKLLDSCDEGKLIYGSYGKTKQFRRGALARLIVNNELSKSTTKSISTERFMTLAKEIYDIFIHESPETYYTPYVQGHSKNPVSARGKLWSAYISARKNFRKFGLLKSIGNRQENTADTFNCEKFFNTDEELQWLKNNSEPFTQVCEYWSRTTSVRLKTFTSIHQYFESFPGLSQPLGYLLIERDFKNLHPEKDNIFFTKFKKIAPKLLEILKSKNDKFIKEHLEEFDETHDNPSEEETQLLTLRLIPLLFVAPLKRHSGNHWKPSKIEIKEGFILHVDTHSDIKAALARRSARYFTFKLTAQPLPVTVGEDNSSYVSINDLLYKVDTPLKAVELCFKTFHVLNANYPYEAESCWLFIQKAIFDINTQFDKNLASVNSLKSDLNILLDE